MKYIPILFIVLNVFGLNLSAQDSTNKDTKVSIDVLRAPISPAANLLGFATSDIQKPSDVTDFMLSLQSATSNYTVLPSNYTVDLAPFWLFRANGLDISNMNTNKIGKVIKQSLVFSIGVRNPDSMAKNFDPKNFYNSFGIRFSLLRGRFTDDTDKGIKGIISRQQEVTKPYAERVNEMSLSDEKLLRLKKIVRQILAKYDNNESEAENHVDYQMAQAEVEGRNREIELLAADEVKSSIEELESFAKDVKVQRVGPFIDLAGGTSLEYTNRRFDNSRIYNAGAWLTFGYDAPKGFSILGLIRYLNNPEQVFADDDGVLKSNDVSTLDGGGRVIYNSKSGRFRLSGEAIYRSVLKKNTLDPSWRLLFNAEYDIGNNQILTFIYGRDFNGTITRDGNLVAALNFIKGFGGKR